MKIGLNGQYLLEQNPAGPELYTLNIFRALAAVDKENYYVVYFSSNPTEDFWKDLVRGNPRFSYKIIPSKFLWTQVGLALELFKDPVDVFFTTIHTIPIVRFPKTRVVSMIHGLEQKFNTYKSPLSRLLKGKHEWFVAKYSGALVVPSEHTKNAILNKNWGVDGKKITVIPEGVASEFYKRTKDEISAIREKYSLGGRYFVFVSTIQPRKNLPRLIEALSFVLKDPHYSDIQLAVAGKKGWQYEESLEAPQKYGVKDSVKFLGRVDQSDLPALLSGSLALINPSLDEGFGLPVLEAMACNIPVLASEIEAFKEVGEDSLIYFNPKDSQAISAGIQDFLSGNVKTETKTAKAFNRSKNFTWEAAAKKLIKTFERQEHE